MLVHLLRSHPDICSHDEVLSSGTLGGITGTYLIKRREEPDFAERMAAIRDRDPIKFLYKIVLDLQGKKAVCFKLKHDELIQPEYKVLRDEIVSDRDFRIIHLRRENLLRRYLSYYIANKVTRVTLAVHGQTVPELQPVSTQAAQGPERFRNDSGSGKGICRTVCTASGFSDFVRGDDYSWFRKLQSLLDFMGVPRRELSTTTQKLGCTDLRKVIANFDELRSYFAGSPFSKFFEDA